MRSFILFTLFIVACSAESQNDISQQEQAWSGPPAPPILCEESKVLCGINCVDISRDMQNCGACNEKCDIAAGEFCIAYSCRDVRNYGFTLEPNGPRAYDVRRDLPRPSPVQLSESGI